jgi:hypothetical protein
MTALLAVLGPAVGASADATGGGWRLDASAGWGSSPSPRTRGDWGVRVGAEETTGKSPPGLLGGLTIDGSLTFSALQGTATAALDIGALRLAWSSGELRLLLPPWLDAIRLAPDPDPQAGEKVAAALPRALLSAALGLLLQPVLGDTRALPLDLLLTSPGDYLSRALAQGGVLQAARVNGLLDAVSTVLGRETTGGLDLPGGLRLHAVDGPFAIRLHGLLDFDVADIHFDIGLGFMPDLEPTPSADLAVTLALPDDASWGGLTIAFGLHGSDLSVSVTPASVTPGSAPSIQILPHFDGLALLGSGATALLPQLLQGLLTEVAPTQAQRGPVLTGALDVATSLGIYAEPQGFTARPRPTGSPRCCGLNSGRPWPLTHGRSLTPSPSCSSPTGCLCRSARSARTSRPGPSRGRCPSLSR